MAKLQQIKRSNGSLIHSVNLPLEDVQESGWEKGDEIIVEKKEATEGVTQFTLTREEDLGKLKGGKKDE